MIWDMNYILKKKRKEESRTKLCELFGFNYLKNRYEQQLRRVKKNLDQRTRRKQEDKD